MQTYYVEDQACLFDPAGSFGKMSREHSHRAGRRARTSASFSRRSRELAAVPYMSLDLSSGAGNLLGESYWEIFSPWRGGRWTRNTGVSPRGVRESSLSQILLGKVQKKYYLTTTACLGILRRARQRGKELPLRLKLALELQSGIRKVTAEVLALLRGEAGAYHINQRNEGIDLGDVSGALLATQNIQMQTFVTQTEDKGVEGFDGYNGDLTGDVAATLGVNCGMSTGRNGVIAFAANQRDEVRDLHDIAGALQAQPGMKQQTFVAGFSAGAGASAGSIGYNESVSPTLKGCTSGNCMPSVLCLNDQGDKVMEWSENITGTLRAQEHGHQPMVFENHGIDARYTGPHDVAPTITSRFGTGGNNTPLVEQDTEVICIAGNIIDRQPQNGGNGFGWQRDISYTLTAMDKHAIVEPYQDTVGALCRGDEKGVGNQYVGQDKCILDPFPTHKSKVVEQAILLIRRLVPLECERLQGFPDGWTDIPGASDSARYKALGNSVAIPCVLFIMQGIRYVVDRFGGADAA